MTKRSPGAERLHQARRAAAKELGLSITDTKVVRLATLEAAHGQIQAQLAAGKPIDVSAMLQIDSALAELRASIASVPPKVEIVFVRSLHEHCRRCGESQEFICRKCGHHETVDDDGAGKLSPMLSSPSSPEVRADSDKPATAAPTPPVPGGRAVAA